VEKGESRRKNVSPSTTLVLMHCLCEVVKKKRFPGKQVFPDLEEGGSPGERQKEG